MNETLMILGALSPYVLVFIGIVGFLIILNRGETSKIEQLKIVDRQTVFANEVAIRGIRAEEDLVKELALARIAREAQTSLQIESIKVANAQMLAMSAQSESSKAQVAILQELMPQITSGQSGIKDDVQAVPETVKINTKQQLDEQSIEVLKQITARLDAGVVPKIGMIQINSEGRVVAANDTSLKLIGLSKDAVIGKLFFNLGMGVVDLDHKALENLESLPFAEALKTGVLAIETAVFGIQAPDRTWKWIVAQMSTIDGKEVDKLQIALMLVDGGSEIFTMQDETVAAFPRDPVKLEESEKSAPIEVTVVNADAIPVDVMDKVQKDALS